MGDRGCCGRSGCQEDGHKYTLEQIGYDLNSAYATAYIDSENEKITIYDVLGENEYNVELYDNGIGIFNGGRTDRWRYDSQKDALLIESYGVTVTYKR